MSEWCCGNARQDPAEERLPDLGFGSMPYDYQGSTNGCGTTSLAMVMTYLGVPESRESIDAAIRQLDGFTPPDALMRFARGHGLQAQGYNDGAWPDIEKHIPLGQPCICLVKPSAEIGNYHYVVAAGYGVDPVSTQRYAVLHNPDQACLRNSSCPDATDVRLDEAGLIAAGNDVGWGFHDYYMAFALGSAPPLPAGTATGVQAVLGVLDGVAGITNGIGFVFQPGSAGQLVQGLVLVNDGSLELVICVVGGLQQLVAQWLRRTAKEVPVVSNLVLALADLLDGQGAVIGDLGRGIGNVIADLGTGLGEVIDDLTSGVGGAAGSFGQAFGALSKGDVAGFIADLGGAAAGLAGAAGSAASDAVNAAEGAASDAVNAAQSAASDVFSGL